MTRIPNGTLCLIVAGEDVGRQCTVLDYLDRAWSYCFLEWHEGVYVIDLPGAWLDPGTWSGAMRHELLPLTGGAPDSEPRIVERPREVVA